MNHYTYINCECKTEGLLIEQDDDHYVVSFLGSKKECFVLSWWNRARYIFKVLFTGRAYNDQIILSQANANTLVNFLSSSSPDTSSATFTVDELYMQDEKGDTGPII